MPGSSDGSPSVPASAAAGHRHRVSYACMPPISAAWLLVIVARQLDQLRSPGSAGGQLAMVMACR
jgi:hypothetical protein